MWWKITLMVLVLMAVFFVIGLYAGGMAFLVLTGGHYGDASFHTLADASTLRAFDKRLVMLPWAWAVTVALTFLPLGVTLIAFILRVNPKQSLYGDARFASASELKRFEYTGEYQKQ
jgi:hypothetical protein